MSHPETAAAPALEIVDLKFAYSNASDRVVLHLPKLAIARGEQVLLRGGSGTGKSTLLQLIAGLMDPTGGVIKVAGQNVHALGSAARDRFRGVHIGMIFQTFNLLAGFSAAENVLAALMFSQIPEREHSSKASALLSQLGIERPTSLVDHLSVGQQQRVAVARALACDPVIVLADEPTASLDPDNAGVAMNLIQSACRDRGAALLCVSHDPGMVTRFTRVEQLDALQMSKHGDTK
jgi:ABC-type lipoprotein export system ATPase subunit